MTTESRERASNFYDCEVENHHVYDCDLCSMYHVVGDNADAFVCPVAKMETRVATVLFHPNK